MVFECHRYELFTRRIPAFAAALDRRCDHSDALSGGGASVRAVHSTPGYAIKPHRRPIFSNKIKTSKVPELWVFSQSMAKHEEQISNTERSQNVRCGSVSSPFRAGFVTRYHNPHKLTLEMHRAGISVRMLGVLHARLRSKRAQQRVRAEMVAR